MTNSSSDHDHSLALAARDSSFGHLLFRVSRGVNEEAVRRLRERHRLPGLRTAHTLLLPHVDFQGTRLTELARRLGVSKQAVGQLVDELEHMGLLERVPDPSDGRGRLVRFRGGPEALLPGLRLLAELEAELAEAVGPERLAHMKGTLGALLRVVEGWEAGDGR